MTREGLSPQASAPPTVFVASVFAWRRRLSNRWLLPYSAVVFKVLAQLEDLLPWRR